VQDWSLNPGRYIGVAERAADDFEFAVRLEELHEELETRNSEARALEDVISENVSAILRNYDS
jgi:type I restriction enzyme M protein